MPDNINLGKTTVMDDGRIEQAVQRIEAALARIAEAADTLRPAPPSVSALVVKHENLNERVAGALRDLDKLIEGLEK